MEENKSDRTWISTTKKGENKPVDDQCPCSDTSLDQRGGKVPTFLNRRGKNEESKKVNDSTEKENKKKGEDREK